MSSKNKRKRGSSDGVAASEEVNLMIKDPRFSSAHTDPRFRTVPRRQTKVAIDSRFQSVLTDKASAPVDKRGKRMRKGRGKDSLKEFYRIDEDEDEDEEETKKEKKDNENEDESEGEKEIMDEGKSEESEEEESEKKLGLKLVEESESDEEAESGEEEEEEEEEDTDEDDEASYEDDGPEIPEEKIATIEKETHRLAIVGMDWRHVSAKDLYALLNSLLPKDGRLLSVAVYPSEFGLERMKEEEIHGPAIEGLRKKEDDDDEEEEDEDVINEKLRDYEKSRLRYYYGVAECDSSATADYLYKSCDGIELERSSNKLDLRFIPDSMEFVHPPRDIATEAPADYVGLDFLSRALQMSNVNLSWDEDEPHRVKTLNQKFKPHQLAELELKEYLASDDDSESEEDDNQGINLRKEKYRALFESEGVNSDKDNEEENDQDMEVTFNTGLEDLSRKQLEKKEKKSETVWESVQRRVREKKRAKKNKQNDDSSSPDDDDSDDDKVVKDDGDDDFFMKQPPLEKKKDKKKKKKKKSYNWTTELKSERENGEMSHTYTIKASTGGEKGKHEEKEKKEKKEKKKKKEKTRVVVIEEEDEEEEEEDVESEGHGAIVLRKAFARRNGAVRSKKGKNKEMPLEYAVVMIQRTFRAYLIRRSKSLRALRDLAIAKTKLKQLRASFNNFSYRRLISRDAEERQKFSEKIIVLLLTVDAIEGVDVMVRGAKRSMVDELEAMLDVVDPQPQGKSLSMRRRTFDMPDSMISKEIADGVTQIVQMLETEEE